MNASTFAKQRAKIEHRAGARAAWMRKAMEHLVREADATTITVRGHAVAWQLPNGQVVCVKRRYTGQPLAEFELKHIRAKSTRDHVPLRAYSCQHCGGWHLTSEATRAANDNNPA
jgi:hypothetical protein